MKSSIPVGQTINNMHIKVIQLVGPCTGIADFNFPAFNEAASILRSNRFVVINPAEIYNEMACGSDGEHESIHITWETMMRKCIEQLLRADTIVRLEGWEDSKGANIENIVAKTLGLNIVDWPDFKKHLVSQIRTYEENQPIVITR